MNRSERLQRIHRMPGKVFNLKQEYSEINYILTEIIDWPILASRMLIFQGNPGVFNRQWVFEFLPLLRNKESR